MLRKRKSIRFWINNARHEIASDAWENHQPEHHGIERRLTPIEVPCGADEGEDAWDVDETEGGPRIAEIVSSEKGFLWRMLRIIRKID